MRLFKPCLVIRMSLARRKLLYGSENCSDRYAIKGNFISVELNGWGIKLQNLRFMFYSFTVSS